jgi:hypothetical protein
VPGIMWLIPAMALTGGFKTAAYSLRRPTKELDSSWGMGRGACGTDALCFSPASDAGGVWFCMRSGGGFDKSWKAAQRDVYSKTHLLSRVVPDYGTMACPLLRLNVGRLKGGA